MQKQHQEKTVGQSLAKGEKEMEVEISERSKKEYWDNYSVVTTSYTKGLAEGREEGLAEGEQKKALETARKMKADGMTAELIAKYTGLTTEIVETV